jgi:hypothetical protein
MTPEEYFNNFLTKLFGVDMLLVMEDTAYMLKREEHPE